MLCAHLQPATLPCSSTEPQSAASPQVESEEFSQPPRFVPKSCKRPLQATQFHELPQFQTAPTCLTNTPPPSFVAGDTVRSVRCGNCAGTARQNRASGKSPEHPDETFSTRAAFCKGRQVRRAHLEPCKYV